MDESITNVIQGLEEKINSGETDGLELIAALLSIEDEQFEIIKPVLLDSFEEILNEPNSQFTLLQLVNSGLISTDEEVSAAKIIEAIKSNLKENQELSESKIDFLTNFISIVLNAVNKISGAATKIVNIPIEICEPNAKLPTYATDGSAAMDIYSPEEYAIEPGETVLISTGLKVDIPRGYALLIHPRSGISLRSKLRVPNSIGLIDSDYHGVIGVMVENIMPKITDVDLYNNGETTELVKDYGGTIYIGKGERFAQMRLVEVPVVNWVPVESIGDFNKDNDHGAGYGSTGKE